MRLLFYGESPAVTTGLAQVSRTVLDALVDEHEIEVIGINHFLIDYDHNRYPYLIHQCPPDDCQNKPNARDRILNGDYDVFMYSADFGGVDLIFEWLREARAAGKQFVTIAYCAMDCDMCPAGTFNYFAESEVSITYTEHARRVITSYRPELAVSVIPLACEPASFYPLSPEERKEAREKLFGIGDDKFLVININRNQPRKDLGRTLMIFHEFHKTHPNSILYMHCQRQDVGGDLPTMAASLGMCLSGPDSEVIFTPENFPVIAGFSTPTMNRIYNAADCLVSTSMGEGWGLSTTEAMAAGCPVIVPRNTAFVEIVGENEPRGFLAETGGDIDHRFFSIGNNPRDIVHADSMLDKLNFVYKYKYVAEYRAKQARKWTLDRTAEQIGKHWKSLFKKIEESFPVKEVSNVR